MKYVRPELNIIELDEVDIIQTSTEQEEDKLPFLPATFSVSELDKKF